MPWVPIMPSNCDSHMKKLLTITLLLLAGMGLHAQRSDNNYQPPKADVAFSASTLPVVVITTGNQTLDRREAVSGTVRIIDNGAGNMNYPDTEAHTGQTMTYNGQAQLMYWGGTEFTHQAKKPLTIVEKDGARRTWLLQSLYADRSLIRSQLTTTLAQYSIGRLAKSRHCEVVMDGIYYGVYLLCEQGDAVTVPMTDYLLAAELAHDTECYRFYASGEDTSAKTVNVERLDSYIGYGNNYAQDGWRTDTWVFDQNATLQALADPWRVPAAWATVTTNSDFKTALRKRWAQLRASQVYSDSRITEVVDSLTNMLKSSGALDRDTEAWGRWGHRVWPNYETPTSYDDEITRLKTWIQQRLEWMDERLSGNEVVITRGPLTIASGYNADVIVEAETPSSHVNADLDDNNFVFYSAAYRSSGGLPADGAFTGSSSGVSYQLGNYAANNILRLGTKGSSGTLTLSEPTAVSMLYIVAMGGNGNGSYSATINYEGGATKAFNKSTKDWGSGSGVIRAYRMLSTNGSVNTNMYWNLYEDSVEVDAKKKMVSVTFTSTADKESGYQPVVSIFALSGKTEQVISGIEEVPAEDEFFEPVHTTYYDLNGRQQPQLQGGLNIVVERNRQGQIRRRKVIISPSLRP